MDIKRYAKHMIYNVLKGKSPDAGFEYWFRYTPQQLREHFQSLFKKGMTWDNYGKWHMDHVIPQCRFSYINEEDQGFADCWSLKNLQPLWAEENFKKGKRI